jgi:hypothetical protein
LKFNWLDYALIGTMASITAIQFLRSTKDFSRVLYETLFIVGAVVTASVLLRPLGELTRLSNPLLLGGVGGLLSVLGIILAAFLNRLLPFGLGVFNYLFGLLLALACAYALGHLGVRTADLAVSPHNREFDMVVRRSLVARDLLFFKTFIEIRAFLRFARWKGM